MNNKKNHIESGSEADLFCNPNSKWNPITSRTLDLMAQYYAIYAKEQIECQKLSREGKFKCPYCEKEYDLSDSVIIEERPNYIMNFLKGWFTTQRLALPHHIKFTVYQPVYYVRKCKKCDGLYHTYILISLIFCVCFNIICALLIIYVLKWKPLSLAFSFALSFFIFPVVRFFLGKRLCFNQELANKYNAFVTKKEYKKQLPTAGIIK